MGRRLSIDPTLHYAALDDQRDFQPALEGVDPFEQEQGNGIEIVTMPLPSHACPVGKSSRSPLGDIYI